MFTKEVKMEEMYSVDSEEGKIICFKVKSYERKIGEVVLKVKDKRLWLDLLIVEKEFRNRGFGKLILSYIERFALNTGLKEIALNPYPYSSSIEELKEWYRERGFKELKDNLMFKRLDEYV
ncbi:hypothetical protein HRbin06_00687 [archaeon HR06]|nr:hypothetical protein HRbin06_00687 [archaeon HR06]